MFARVMTELEQQQHVKVTGKRGQRTIKMLSSGQRE